MALQIDLNGANIVAVKGSDTYYIPSHVASFTLSNSTLTLFEGNRNTVVFEASNDIQDKDGATLASDAAVIAYLTQFVGISDLHKANSSSTAKVNCAAATFTVLAANKHRQKAILVNNSAHKLYVKLGSGAAVDSFTYYREASTKTEIVIEGYTGIITAVADGATGDVQVTEVKI